MVELLTANILIVDDHAVVRQGIRQILIKEFPEASFGEAGNAAEALAVGLQGQWDLAIIDISLPGKNGILLLKELREAQPGMATLIFSMHSEEEYAVRALKAGASGYLAKGCSPDELIGAVRKVLSGGKFITPGLAERLAGEIGRNTDRSPHEYLSDREFQIFCMFAKGKSVREIAWELPLSENTVRTYRARILHKMKMKSTVEMIRYALERNLV